MRYRSDSRNPCPMLKPIPAISLTLTHLSLEASNERVEEVDDGELDEGGEDVDEAEDDEDVEGGGVAHLRLVLAAESDRHNRQHRGRAQRGPGRNLAALS